TKRSARCSSPTSARTRTTARTRWSSGCGGKAGSRLLASSPRLPLHAPAGSDGAPSYPLPVLNTTPPPSVGVASSRSKGRRTMATQTLTQAEPAGRKSVKRERILVIEDEGDIVDLLKYNLKKDGFEVDAAADGERGLDLARSRSYDLVVLDIMLP